MSEQYAQCFQPQVAVGSKSTLALLSCPHCVDFWAETRVLVPVLPVSPHASHTLSLSLTLPFPGHQFPSSIK